MPEILMLFGGFFILLLIIYFSGKVGYRIGYKEAKNEIEDLRPFPLPKIDFVTTPTKKIHNDYPYTATKSRING